jgi:hypothetical protein
MARRAFYSFHYVPDNWRAGKVRNMGIIEGNRLLSDNGWEQVINRGDSAIQNWIDGEMEGKSCTIVLVGSQTAGRKWINYEIKKAWNDNKGVLGIYIHNLTDRNNHQSVKGDNPFTNISLQDGRRLSSVAKCYNPPQTISSNVYAHIAENIEHWVEEAITIRRNV